MKCCRTEKVIVGLENMNLRMEKNKIIVRKERNNLSSHSFLLYR